MKKQSMTVAGFRVTAWKDALGLMRMEIKSSHGKEVMHSLDTPWENSGGALDRIAFTDSVGVIEFITGPTGPESSEDRRMSPDRLRRAAKDPVEAGRRREGRDPATGALIANSQVEKWRSI